MSSGLVLYGPPAVGKDTITAELVSREPRFAHFPVIKAGSGRTTGYRLVTVDEFDKLDRAGELVVTWHRYGSRYGVAHSTLAELTSAGKIPVIHLGSGPAVQAVTALPPLQWTVVQLWASRETCAARARARNTGDFAARMAVYDETERIGDDLAHLTIDTDSRTPGEAAQAILHLTTSRHSPTHPALNLSRFGFGSSFGRPEGVR